MHYMETAFEPAERIYRRTITHATFGHLAPQPLTIYCGYILFTHGCTGDITIIDYRFVDPDGAELDSSPWLWEDINEYVGDLILPRLAIKSRLPAGRVYQFNGTYHRTEDEPKDEDSDLLREGEGVFRGRVRRVRLSVRRKR